MKSVRRLPACFTSARVLILMFVSVSLADLAITLHCSSTITSTKTTDIFNITVQISRRFPETDLKKLKHERPGYPYHFISFSISIVLYALKKLVHRFRAASNKSFCKLYYCTDFIIIIWTEGLLFCICSVGNFRASFDCLQVKSWVER